MSLAVPTILSNHVSVLHTTLPYRSKVDYTLQRQDKHCCHTRGYMSQASYTCRSHRLQNTRWRRPPLGSNGHRIINCIPDVITAPPLPSPRPFTGAYYLTWATRLEGPNTICSKLNMKRSIKHGSRVRFPVGLLVWCILRRVAAGKLNRENKSGTSDKSRTSDTYP